MKSLVVFFAVVLALSSAQNSELVSAGSAVDYGTATLMQFMNETQCSGCPGLGCCPKIVTSPPSPADVASVIQPVPGYRGNVAIIVDWGPAYWWGRACTTSDRGFIYFISWGDGSPNTVETQDILGPFQQLHQYPKYDWTYGITVYYCSNPDPNNPARRCCSSMYRTIDVSEDPNKLRFV